MEIADNIIHRLLQNVYFITGTACAGKSTAVRLLAEELDGICCGENYHMELQSAADPAHQPALCYFDTMPDWQAFIHRSPEDYAKWIEDSAAEAAQLELILLLRLVPQGRPVFVDTNIPLEQLHRISDERHVAVMLSPQSLSVERFFDRSDPDKRFLLRQIQAAPDPAWAMENYRQILRRVNSQAVYDAYANSGFRCFVRTPERTIPEALEALKRHFGFSANGSEGRRADGEGVCTPSE